MKHGLQAARNPVSDSDDGADAMSDATLIYI